MGCSPLILRDPMIFKTSDIFVFPMPISPEEIDLLCEEASENQHIEFKEAKTQYDFTKLCRYCVAFANEGGGFLYLGITDKLPRRVVGSNAFPNTNKIEQDLYNKLHFRVDIEEVQHPDGRVLVFKSPSRPRGTVYQVDDVRWMRAGSQLVPMSDDRLRAIFAEGQPDWGQPDWLQEDAKSRVSGQEVVDMLDTQAFFELLGIPYPSNQAQVLERLEDERIIKRNVKTFSISRFGALLFAKNLKDFREVSEKAIRIISYAGTRKTDSVKRDITETKGYAAGFSSAMQNIMLQIPASFETFKNGIRRENTLIPEICIRELLANAIIHQDFQISGLRTTVEIYKGRIEITNPGVPIIDTDRFIDGVQSRNEVLAGFMRRIGICEERGSGIDKVIKAAEEEQLPPPEFRVSGNQSVAIVFEQESFNNMSRDEKVRACYQHCVLMYLGHDRMTNKSLRERFHLQTTRSKDISQIISQAVRDERIRPDEKSGTSKRFARYVPYWA